MISPHTVKLFWQLVSALLGLLPSLAFGQVPVEARKPPMRGWAIYQFRTVPVVGLEYRCQLMAVNDSATDRPDVVRTNFLADWNPSTPLLQWTCVGVEYDRGSVGRRVDRTGRCVGFRVWDLQRGETVRIRFRFLPVDWRSGRTLSASETLRQLRQLPRVNPFEVHK